MPIKSYKALVKAAKEGDTYWIESVKHDFAFSIHRQLKRHGITNAALAKKLGVTPPYVSKVLKGDENLTIESMVKMVRAANGRLHLEVADQADGLRWLNVINGQKNEFVGNAEAFRKSKQIKEPIYVPVVEELEAYVPISNNA
jgi:transcriptional regulator with XRE-family HTH domain